MRRGYCLFISLFVCFPLFACAGSETIYVDSQAQFDALEGSINAAIAKGKNNIRVELSEGPFCFEGGKLRFASANASTSISIHGNSTVLFAKGRVNPDTVNPENTYLILSNLSPVNLWGPVFQADGNVEVTDKAAKTCRIRLKAPAGVKAGDWIRISRWYTSSTHRIIRVKDGYAFFTVEDLAFVPLRMSYNINSDYFYGGLRPRYRIMSAESLKGWESYECSANNFLNVDGVGLKSFRMEGVDFRGCAYTVWKGLIRFNGIKAERIEVRNCSFRGCRSVVLNICGSSGFLCEDCLFEDNHDGCIVSDNASEGSRVLSCTFRGGGGSWTNVMEVRMEGKDFRVADNVFSDFGYGAVSAGLYWEKNRRGPCSGVVEGNHIFHSASFRDARDARTLMDSGAIYLFTMNDGVTVRYNCIHDIVGMKDNRGIFCDDGAYGFTIEGNVIYNIGNSYCIDSRRVPEVEKKTGRFNEGNVIRGNVLDGSVRFESSGRKGNGCIKGKNYLLDRIWEEGSSRSISLSGLEKKDDDVILALKGIQDGRLSLGRNGMKLLKKNPYYKHIKKYFEQ